MFPPIFATCSVPSITSLIGSNPVRLWPFGEADQEAERPYAVWQTIGGHPEDYLDRRPDMDLFSIQVDVYAKTGSEARYVAQAIRDAVEGNQAANITAWRGESRDQVTKDYRYTFDVDWFVPRSDEST